MSTAPWEPEPNGEGLVAPQRRQTKNRAVAALPVDGARRSGPRLRLQLPDLSTPALSTAVEPAVTSAADAQAEGSVVKPSLLERLSANGIVVGVKHYFGAAVRIVLLRNVSLLLQPQVLLQPKLAIAGLGAVVMTAATLILSGGRETKDTDQLGAAPAWTPPTIAAPDWNTVAQPVTTPSSAEPAPAMPAPTDASNAVSREADAPAWTPAATANHSTTAAPNVPGAVTSATAGANMQATAPRAPEVVARRPETPRPYPATFAPEKPPQARITGNITVLPGEPTP